MVVVMVVVVMVVVVVVEVAGCSRRIESRCSRVSVCMEDRLRDVGRAR